MDKLLKEIKSLSNYQLEILVNRVSDIRKSRLPEIPIEFPVANVAKPIIDPAYRISFDHFSGRTVMCFRHPGMGWLHFMFRAKERDRIVQIISGHNKNFGCDSGRK